jgi:membrane associated rhomboid family serine protease
MFIFIPIPIAAKYFVPGIILIDLLAGFTGFSIFGDNVAHFAHVGGGLVGLILVLLLRGRARTSHYS